MSPDLARLSHQVKNFSEKFHNETFLDACMEEGVGSALLPFALMGILCLIALVDFWERVEKQAEIYSSCEINEVGDGT